MTAIDTTSSPEPALVEARSNDFTVYSPRKYETVAVALVDTSFPGLPRQTELAEHFGKMGFKLNTRKVGIGNIAPALTSEREAGSITITRQVNSNRMRRAWRNMGQGGEKDGTIAWRWNVGNNQSNGSCRSSEGYVAFSEFFWTMDLV